MNLDLTLLYDGVRVRARFARRDNKAGTAPDWGPPKDVSLRIVRRPVNIRHGKQILKAGAIIGLTVQDVDWAEYSEDDYVGNGEFLAEEYRMKIHELL